jgi:hypothetical protein
MSFIGADENNETEEKIQERTKNINNKYFPYYMIWVLFIISLLLVQSSQFVIISCGCFSIYIMIDGSTFMILILN